METTTYIYDGKLWKASAAVMSMNSFFHAAFGERLGEDGAYFDRLAQFRRMRWGTFLTYFVTESMPSSLADVLNKCFSANDRYKQASLRNKRFLLRYVSEVMSAEKVISVEDIPVLATLENIKIVVLSKSESNLPLRVFPNADILGGYPNTERSKDEVVLCLKGSIFSRLEPVDEDANRHLNKFSLPVEHCVKNDVNLKEMKYNKEFSTPLSIKYEKGGSAGSKGVEFQVSILTLFLLNAMQKLNHWRLSTENKAAGKFDDAVLESDDGCLLLQAKYKEVKSRKITYQDLMSTNSKNDDFSLPKYYLSFEEIKSNFKVKNLIICTNASLDGKVMKFVRNERVRSDSMLYCEGNFSFVTFKEEIVLHLKENVKIYHENNVRNKSFDEIEITDEKLKHFLKYLQFYSNYLVDAETEQVAENLLKNLPRKISYSDIYAKVMDWFQQKNGVYFTKISARATFYDIRRDKYWQKLDQYDVDFSLKDSYFQGPKNIFHVVVESGSLLQEMKIYRTLKEKQMKVLYIYPSDRIATQGEVIEAFGLAYYTHLVMVRPKTAKELVIQKIGRKLRNILDRYQYKKVILVAPHDSTLPKYLGEDQQVYKVINKPVIFQDLSEDTKKKLVSKKQILYQGEKISLEELFALERSKDYDKFLNAETTEMLINNKYIRVGVRPSNLKEHVAAFYITRTFQREPQSLDDNIVETTVFPEENINEIQDKVVVVSDCAGAGKSTVLTNLANTIKRKHPHLWVIRIELTDYTTFLSQTKSSDKHTFTVTELLNSKNSTKLTNDLEKAVFSLNRRVVLMLDGVDEVSPDYATLITNLLVQCQRVPNFEKIFVTTRPCTSLKLEEQLGVKSLELQPFSRRNQIDFLTNYWTLKLDVSATHRKECEQYAEALIEKMLHWIECRPEDNFFAAIPLQARMLAEIFLEGNLLGKKDWQGCKEYLETGVSGPRLPERIDITRLYEMFIEKKRQVFVRKGNPSGHPAANKALVELFEKCLLHHQSIALEVILSKNKRNLFSCYQRIHEDAKPDILRIGVVQEAEGNFLFVHRTFAEYFIAKSLPNELICNKKVEFRKYFLEEVLRSDQFHVIRIFFDGFLNKELDKVPGNTYQEFRKSMAKMYISKGGDIFYRLASEGCVAILRFIFKCVEFTPVRGKETFLKFGGNYLGMRLLDLLKDFLKRGGVNIKDESDRTPLYYAVKNGHLSMVKYLVKNGANVNLCSHRDGSLVLEALKGTHLDITQFLIQQGAEIDPHTVYTAVAENNSDAAKVFLDCLLKSDEMGSSCMPAYLAAYLGRLDVLKTQIERGVAVNCKMESYESLMFGAVRGGHLDVIEYLAREGADVNIRDDWKKSVLHRITRRPSMISTIQLLVELGVNVNARDIDGLSPLHIAAMGSSEAGSSNMDVVKFLVQHGADIYMEDKGGRTPLHVAASNDQLDIVEFFLGQGMDVNETDNYGRTLLHHASFSAHLKTCKYIVESGVDINARDEWGMTALHSLVLRDRRDVIELLLAKGADVNVTDQDGNTALRLSSTKKDLTLFEFLSRRSRNVAHSSSTETSPDIADWVVASNEDINDQNQEWDTTRFLQQCFIDSKNGTHH